MNEATKQSVRTGLTAGVAVMTAAAIAFVPSVAQPTAHPTATPAATVRVVSPPVALTAAVQPLSTAAVPHLLANWLEEIAPSAASPTALGLPPTAIGTSIDSAIKNTYNAVEPWVRYGFELATYAVGWVPVVGWLAPQIMIFYNFGERIVRSITFNVADFIGGNVSFGQGLVNVGRDTINSFIYLANDELNFFLPGFPPLPPIGRVAGLAEQKVAVKGIDVASTSAGTELDTTAGTEPGTSTGTDVPEDQTPEPKTIDRPFRGGGLTKLIQRFTGSDAPSRTTSVSVQTLGEEQTEGQNAAQDQSTAGDQTRQRPRGLIGTLNSAVRDLVASVPHPARDRAVPAKPEKDGPAKDNAGDSE